MRPIAMKSFGLLALSAAVLAGAGCLSISVGTRSNAGERTHAAAPENFVLKLSGGEGMKFTGSVTTDGVVQQLEGALPYEFRVSARTLACEFKKNGGAGMLTLDVTRGDPASGVRCAVQDDEGVRAVFDGVNSIVTGF